MLTERQKRILWAVISDYITTAEPVGSRTVSKKDGVGYSAATIRNEMADLEEMGYLEQPHTSAGRIPSQKGYRFYVDHLIKPTLWTSQEKVFLQMLFRDQIGRIEQAIEHTSSIISNLTNYMSIILGPKLADKKLKHLQIVPLFDRTAVSILVSDTGQVHQQRVALPESVPFSSIESLVNLLNFRLRGIQLSKLKSVVERELSEELARHVDHFESLTDLINGMFDTEVKDEVFTSGTTRMLDQPEFQDLNKMKPLLDLIEERGKMIQLLRPLSEGVQVRIGTEHDLATVNYCSIISASYMINGSPVGTIAVLGPTRMDYGRVIKLIDYLAKELSNQLGNLFD